MSPSLLDTYERVLAATRAGDVEAFVACCRPDVVYLSIIGELDGRYEGHDGIRSWFANVAETFPDLAPRSTAAWERPPWVFGEGHATGTGPGSGIELEWDYFQVVRLDSDGLVVWAISTRDRESALQAAGLDAWPE